MKKKLLDYLDQFIGTGSTFGVVITSLSGLTDIVIDRDFTDDLNYSGCYNEQGEEEIILNFGTREIIFDTITDISSFRNEEGDITELQVFRDNLRYELTNVDLLPG